MRITLRTIEDMVTRFVRPLRARLESATKRGVVVDLDDSTGLARGQSTAGADQVADDIEFISPFGLSSRPPDGAETILWSIGARVSHTLAMIFDRRARLKGELAAGEVALHIGVAGQVVWLKADGSVEVRASEADGGSIVLKANGDIVVVPGADGRLYLGQDGATKKVALADDVDARLDLIQARFDGHVHPGVTAGPGSTAVTATLIGALAPTGADNVFGRG